MRRFTGLSWSPHSSSASWLSWAGRSSAPCAPSTRAPPCATPRCASGAASGEVLLAGEYLLALTFVWVSLLPLQASAEGGKGPPGLAAVLVLPLLFVIWSSIYLRHLRPLPAPHRSAAETGGHPEGDAERHWRQGAFYVNPDDPALWVPKRSGLGYTLNFAHPASWPLLILLTAGPLAFLAWLFFHAR